MTRGRAEGGSASVWALSAVGVVAAATLAAVALGQAALARHRAAGAADAAALTAALHVLDAGPAACGLARSAARADGGRLTRCSMSGPVASVRVVVDGPPWLRWLGSAQAEARAGPATTHTE